MTTPSEITQAFKERLLKWLSETSGESIENWERVSQGDVICFVLHRLSPGCIALPQVTDGVDRFARVGNWRLVNQAMRKLKMNWDYDQVKLVLADQPELERLVQAMRRWEIRNLEEPLEPPSPDEWNDRDTPAWFTQQSAKLIEEKRLAMGESRAKQQKQVVVKEDLRRVLRAQRVPIAEQMRGRVSRRAEVKPA
jgi:hypothetical protein